MRPEKHKRASRRELEKNRFLKRLKRLVAGDGTIDRNEDIMPQNVSERVIYPTWMYHYKTTSVPCSCYMCSPHKYDRREFRKDTRKEIGEGLD